ISNSQCSKRCLCIKNKIKDVEFMDLGLAGKHAIVLAAGGGLGSAIAASLAGEGVHLSLVDISTEGLSETQKLLSHTEVRTEAIQWDMNDVSAVGDVASQATTSLGPVDILVNITGGPKPSTVSLQASHDW